MIPQARINPILRKKAVKNDVALNYILKESPKKQEIKYCRREFAKEAIGTLSHDSELYILSKGQFSLVEFLWAIIKQIGAADMVVSTWTAAGADMAELYNFLQHGNIKSCRFLVDTTFARRQPAMCGQLRNLFGDECIRVTKNHAKLAVLTNKNWNINIFTSANLNTNPRMEYFIVREDAGFAKFNLKWLNDLFKSKSKDDIKVKEDSWHVRQFKKQ